MSETNVYEKICNCQKYLVKVSRNAISRWVDPKNIVNEIINPNPITYIFKTLPNTIRVQLLNRSKRCVPQNPTALHLNGNLTVYTSLQPSMECCDTGLPNSIRGTKPDRVRLVATTMMKDFRFLKQTSPSGQQWAEMTH